MTNTQLILSDTNKAYRQLITSAELDARFTEIRNGYKLPVAPTSEDFKKADQYALLQMFGVNAK